MKHQDIRPGMVLKLKPSAKIAYGLDAAFEVSHLQPRVGYSVPWVCVKSNRPESGILFFRPSDFAKATNQ